MTLAKLTHKAGERNSDAGKTARGHGRTNERLKMTEVVRCPYCVLDDHFRPMSPRPDGWFICTKCGHSANPVKPEFKCFCQKCGELSRAA
jgi:DNA-directed RNA polymerase subunit RPC12/RpoP